MSSTEINSLEFLSKLSNDISWLLHNSDDCDVLIQVGEEPNSKGFPCHIAILRARSSYFRRALSKDWSKREPDGLVYFFKPNVQPEMFEKYIYCASMDFSEEDEETLLKLLTLGDELMLDQYCIQIQHFLIGNKYEWLEENLVETLRITNNCNSCTLLRNHCLELIAEKPASIFRSEGFISLEEELLVSALKETLSQCIPLIRYFSVASSDYYDHIIPFKKILPPELNDDILRYHLKPGSIPNSMALPPRDQGMNLDSLIIKPSHARIICNWIDGRDIVTPTFTKATYDFRLLVRGSSDGFDASKFHARCDRKGATVVFIRIENSGEIIGGYNSAYWRTGAIYIHSDKSFLFSLGDGKKLQNAILSRIRDSPNAMYGHTSYGPHFGTSDLRMYTPFNNKENCSCQPGSYYKPITENVRFSAGEYEVFQLIPK
ncbi:3268_t:CDS:2 [Entrophospora sp. SA101]|nr:3268_t:CDS:2 [Entrophospora sp. SA101]